MTIKIKETGVSLWPTMSPADGHLTTPTVAGLPCICENFRPTAVSYLLAVKQRLRDTAYDV